MITRHRSRTVTSDIRNVSFWYPITYDANFKSEVMDDVVVPNFGRLSRAGQIIINPLVYRCDKKIIQDDTITHQSVGYDPFTPSGSSSAHYLRGTLGYLPQSSDFVVGNGSLPGTPAILDEETVSDDAKQAALAFVDKPQYDFAEDILSIRETIAFLRNPLRSMVNLIASFKKKQHSISSSTSLNAKAKARALAEMWASYNFALRPLIQTIDNAIAAFYDDTVPSLRRTSRSKKSLSISTSLSYEGFNASNGNRGFATVTNVNTVEFHCGVVYEAPQFGTLTEKLGLRLKDMPATIWELAPLSFMLDRVLNVKNMISSLLNLADPSVKVKGGFVMKRQTLSHTVMLDRVVPPSGTSIVTFSPLPHYEEIFLMERSLWIPQLSDSMPIWNPSELVKDLTSLADLVSLITLRGLRP